MRRIAIVGSQARTCVALFQWDAGNAQSLRQVRALWSAGGIENDWYESYDGMNDAPWALSSFWPYMFVFGDGLIGMCRSSEVDAALASCGLRLTEGGE